MRFFRIAAAAALVMGLGFFSASAHADGPHNFGDFNCPQTFSCSNTPSDQLASMANDCTVSGFGITSQQSGLFDSAVPDSDDCMTGAFQSVPGARPMVPKCCVVNEGSICGMHCQLLMY